MFDKIKKIENKIGEFLQEKYSLSISNIFGGPVSEDNSIYMSFQFFDCLEKNKCGSCIQTKILSEKGFMEIYEFLESFGIRTIEINYYSNGTQIGFIVPFHEESFDFLKVTCPEVSSEILTIGESYYVGFEKYRMNETSYENKYKLLEIVRSPGYGFNLIFEGISEPISVFTRAHCSEKEVLLNRIELLLITTCSIRFKRTSFSEQ
jgi:hypothetical protein